MAFECVINGFQKELEEEDSSEEEEVGEKQEFTGLRTMFKLLVLFPACIWRPHLKRLAMTQNYLPNSTYRNRS